MGMNLSSKINVSPKVMARQVGDETVILDLNSGVYFGLDPIGARIWQLLSEDRTLAETCDVMLQEYEVDREKLESDMIALMETLKAHGLIT